MELKPGYKQTEVGVIPEEWCVKTLGALTSLLTNGFVGTVTNFYTDAEDGILYIQGYNVEENGYNLHGIKRVTKAFHNQHQKSCLQEGDLLTIQTGDIGVTTVVPKEFAGANCHALVISRLDKKSSDSKFYCQYFNSEKGRIAFKEIETGTTMKHLNVGDMTKLPLPVPPLPEQRAIAAALSDVDSLIASLDKLIAKQRDMKQAAMQELLTAKRRLPGFSEEWEVKKLGDVTEIIDPHPSHRAPPEANIGIPFVGIGDISAGGIIDSKSARIVSASVFDEHSKRYNLSQNLIGLGRVASIGKVVRLRSDVGAFAVSPTMAVVKSISSDLNFIFYYLNSQEAKAHFDRICNGSTRQSVGMNVLREIQIKQPKLIQEQTAIAAILADMDAEIASLEQRRDKTRLLKQGMMQELLTGRIRLV